MDACRLGSPSALLLSALFLVTVSGAQKCVPQALPDTVIDIGRSVARGARFSDPLSVISVEECLSACCMHLDMGGYFDCNLLVFDARKESRLQNCYLFHCPTLDSCPLVPSPGVFSYSLWSDPSRVGIEEPALRAQKSRDHGKAQSSPKKTPGSAPHPSDSAESGPNLDRTGAAIALQGSARHRAKEEPADPSRSVTLKLLHLAGQTDQRLEKMEPESDGHPSTTAVVVPAIRGAATGSTAVKNILPHAKMAKAGKNTYKKPQDLKISFPTAASTSAGTVPNRTRLGPSTSAPQPVPRTKAGVWVPSAGKKNPKLPGRDQAPKNGAPTKVDPLLPQTEVPALTTAQTKQPPVVTHPPPLRTTPWTGIEPSAKTPVQPHAEDKGKRPTTAQREEAAAHLEDGARSGGILPSLEDKSGLVAALIFGMLFLMVVIGLVSRKVSEARRRHRYTKLDYLINGMYVDT